MFYVDNLQVKRTTAKRLPEEECGMGKCVLPTTTRGLAMSMRRGGYWLLALTWCIAAVATEDQSTVRPADNGAELCNPGMGWVFHYYDNIPEHYGSKLAASDTLDGWPGLTVIYLRIPWSYIEPEEGRFNWSVLDTPAQRWIAKGKQVAFRITCSESWTRWATPKWVHDAGAKGYDFRPGKGVEPGGPFWEPDFDDPVFLQKLDRFLAAMAARYDGNPDVAFVDVGSLGVWGEGHTWASTKRPLAPATVKRHIDLHKKHFPKTLLVANDDMGGPQTSGPNEVVDYAVAQGLTLRDDSILVQPGKNAYFHATWAQPFWPRVPVILESEHYGGSKSRGCWQDGSLYLKAVEDYHASYASIHWWPSEFLEENRELVRRINLRLGYRLQLVEASWPKTVRIGSPLAFTSAWRNAGVAPCLPGGHPAVTFKDSKGGIAAVLVDDSFDVRSLPVAGAHKAQSRAQKNAFLLPMQLGGGRYELFLSVGTRTGTPRLALPLDSDDGRWRYRLGSMQVVGDYGVQAGILERRGDGYYMPLTWTVHASLPQDVQPFCHLDRDGGIQIHGQPEKSKGGSLCSPGVVELGCTLNLPHEVRAKEFSVYVGLWSPDRHGQANHQERMLPDCGSTDRRVLLGTLRVAADGQAAFKLAQP
jgi:hypothetical protein